MKNEEFNSAFFILNSSFFLGFIAVRKLGRGEAFAQRANRRTDKNHANASPNVDVLTYIRRAINPISYQLSLGNK